MVSVAVLSPLSVRFANDGTPVALNDNVSAVSASVAVMLRMSVVFSSTD